MSGTYDILVEVVPFVSAMELPQAVHLVREDLEVYAPEDLMEDQLSQRQAVDHTSQEEDLELRRKGLVAAETWEVGVLPEDPVGHEEPQEEEWLVRKVQEVE